MTTTDNCPALDRDSIVPAAIDLDRAPTTAPAARHGSDLRLGLAAMLMTVLAAVMIVPVLSASAPVDKASGSAHSPAASLVRGLRTLVTDPVTVLPSEVPAPEAVLVADAR